MTEAGKVCHITSAHTCNDVRIFVKQCSSLAAAGFEVHLVAPGCQDAVKNGVRIHGVAGGSGGRITRMTRTVLSVFRKALSLDAGLYHFHDPELIPAGVLLKLAGKRVVFDVHEDVAGQILDKEWIARPLRRGISSAYSLLQRCCLPFFDAVVLAETSYRETLPDGHNYVFVRNYPIAREFSQVLPKHDGDQPYVCYIGTIHPLRGVFEMARAAALSRSKLLLAGQLSPSLYERLKESPGWESVVALGEMNREGVVETLSRSRAGLVVLHPIPNYLKTEPTKMLEYMAAGVPVICSDFPYWRKIVEENDCGICVDPLDPEAIARAIDFFLDNPEEARRMGENGRKVALERYSWDNESRKLRELYASLLPG